MTNLGLLRRKLAMLRRRRALRRLVCGAAPIGTGGVCFLAAIFFFDFLFKLDVVQRAFAIGTGLLILGWFLRRAAWPYLRVRESELQTALHIERQHGIDDQLIAALQFEISDAARRSSPQLELAVIQDARAVSQDLDTMSGFQYRPVVRRGVTFLVAALVTVGAMANFPDHARAFFKRLVWLSVRYPTATVVQRVVINREEVLTHARDMTLPRPIDCAEGESVDFLIQTSGAVAEQGSLRLAALDGQELRTIRLTPQLDPTMGSDSGSETRTYHGQLRRLVTPLRYQIYLGDTWTDPAEIRMIARPIVDFAARVQPPQYTAAGASFIRSVRQLSVPEGSAVRFQLSSTNNKRLRAAVLSGHSLNGESSYQFVQADAEGLQWVLPPEQTMFAAVRDEIRFEVQVTDEDGLALEYPLGGVLSVLRDRAPSVVIHSIHRVVLPHAEPIIDFQVADDFAVAAAILHVRSKRVEPGNAGDDSPDLQPQIDHPERLEISLGASPVPIGRLPLDGHYALDLAELALEKDDQITLIVEVIDSRGDLPGVSSFSEPLILLVSDERGVLAAISEVDEQTERSLSEVIQRQLEVGGR